MEKIQSECCVFPVGFIEEADAYCYVCGEVHMHQHLDLRDLRTILLGRVTARHALNWDEIAKDRIKFQGMENGVFCQSLLTEIEALCPHGKQVYYNEAPLRLHMCFGQDITGKGIDSSMTIGLDFTSDICDRGVTAGHPVAKHDDMSKTVEQLANTFTIGEVLRYNPDRVAFEHV